MSNVFVNDGKFIEFAIVSVSLSVLFLSLWFDRNTYLELEVERPVKGGEWKKRCEKQTQTK